jgi:diguanylate cyclase (GGDEF)-like protein
VKTFENSARKAVWPLNVSAILLLKSGTVQPETPGPFSLKKTLSRLELLFRGNLVDRIPVFQVVRPVSFGSRQGQPDLQICVGISVNHLLEYIRRDLGAVAPWIAGLLVLLTLLAVLLSMDIIMAITKISKAANELSSENYSYRIDLKRKDELGQWASLFNAMASKIALKIRELNDKIAEISRLFKLATEDGLTKAFVHRYLMDLLENEIRRSKRNGTCLSFVMCDIDHFKKFNDTYGHQTGDYVLSKVSQVYMDNVRKNIDVVGRYGGEEFGIILPDTDKRGAVLAAEKIRKAVESAQYSFKGNTFSVTISLGVSTIMAGSTAKETLVKWADKALYNSKEKGRNRTSFYTEDKNVL